jgi:hypothetical protein
MQLVEVPYITLCPGAAGGLLNLVARPKVTYVTTDHKPHREARFREVTCYRA